MQVSELIKKLQAVLDEHGDMEVGYIDNGPFAEHGGWESDLNPVVCPDSDRVGDGLKVCVL